MSQGVKNESRGGDSEDMNAKRDGKGTATSNADNRSQQRVSKVLAGRALTACVVIVLECTRIGT